MIAKLKGKVEEMTPDGLLIDVCGVVYKVSATEYTRSMIKTGQDISILTHQDIKETSSTLYGFLYSDEKEIFELLLLVNGVGPKSALSILNTSNPKTILEGIGSRDPEHFRKLTGIGKKTAEKIIVALKDKVEAIESLGHSDKQDAIEALVSLGYSSRQARETVSGIDKDLSSEKIIKEALKRLAK